MIAAVQSERAVRRPTDQKIAFLILAHADARQLLRLCHRLGPIHDIFVHWDLRTPILEVTQLPFPPNVFFVEQRLPVFWADISIVRASLLLLERALRGKTEYARLVLLSGACYPIKPIEALSEFFAQRPRHNSIRYNDMIEYWSEMAWFVDRFHFREPWIPQLRARHVRNRLLTFPDKAARKAASLALALVSRGFRRRFPNITPYIGSQFWALTPDCARAVLAFVGSHQEFLRYYRFTFAPDEHFFHTIVGNSELASTTDGVLPHMGRAGYNLGNLHVVRAEPFTMAVRAEPFTMADAPNLLRSDKFFVRKVTSEASGDLLDYLDRVALRAPAWRTAD